MDKSRTIIKRIMIIGQPGSGKSFLARKIGDQTGLPVVHIDNIHWQAGWRERSAEEKARLCAEVHAQEQWIFEGGFSRSWDDRLARADVLIWLDIPLWLRAIRVIRRTLQYHGSSRPDLPEGCPERFNWEFTRWIWKTRTSGKKKMQAFYANTSAEKLKFHVQNRKHVSTLLQDLKVKEINDVAA